MPEIPDEANVGNPPRSPGGGWWVSLLLGIVLLGVYLANGREIGQYDTEPTTLSALALIRGDGPFLDRFQGVLREPPDGRLPVYVTRKRGHIVSRYPLVPALVAVPLEWPQVWLLDRFRPGWDRRPDMAWGGAKFLGKNAAAILTALVGVVLHRLLIGLGLRRQALLATLAAMLGSDLWTVASQALWQHGPAALFLSLAVVLLLPDSPSRLRFALAGVSAAMLVACRAIDLPFALVLAAWVAWRHPKRLLWFLPGPVLIGGALVGYNLWLFDALSGGQAELEALHPRLHGVPGPWAGNILEGVAGTLLSPSRGLFVFCPVGGRRAGGLAVRLEAAQALAGRPLDAGDAARLPADPLEVRRLVGGAYVRPEVLDGRHAPVRGPAGGQPGLGAGTRAGGRGDRGPGGCPVDRDSGPWGLLFSDERVEPHARPTWTAITNGSGAGGTASSRAA